MSTEPTGALAEFTSELKLENIPKDVRDSCRVLILDALACALAGHQGEETSQLTAMAASLGQSHESAVFGGQPLSLAGATLLNGYLVTAVTMCDVHRPTLTHVTPEVIPPAFAIAERDDVSGADLLASIAAGLEVTTRIGIGLDYPIFRSKGWHGPGVIGPFGSAAAVGRLRGFNSSTMARAFGLAGAQSAGTFAAWGTPTVKWHQCRGALSGLMAALLAEQNFVATEEFLTKEDGGLYNTYAEGGLPEVVSSDLGSRWELQQIALRLWPSATALQEVLTALYKLIEDNQIDFDDIAKLTIYLSETPYKMHGGFSTYKAKFEALLSAHYVAAVFLRDHTLTLAQFEPASYDDPTLRKFAAERVEIVHDRSLAGGQCSTEVLTQSGKKIQAHCDYPLGAPENPVTSEQIEDKFRTYAVSRISKDHTQNIIDAINDLENVSSTRDLIALLSAA